ncbi:hypothetical protein HNY73_004977 [Argiope bruennichi]|uniref:Uncharacterized protein n=1 Tax=Argiope bruennichi TaxID=94029 RepID=A0A8T0FT70_ARGBR|nr:hypothetical protein HNY73_004977 [Argiope bruennichi]
MRPRESKLLSQPDRKRLAAPFVQKLAKLNYTNILSLGIKLEFREMTSELLGTWMRRMMSFLPSPPDRSRALLSGGSRVQRSSKWFVRFVQRRNEWLFPKHMRTAQNYPMTPLSKKETDRIKKGQPFHCSSRIHLQRPALHTSNGFLFQQTAFFLERNPKHPLREEAQLSEIETRPHNSSKEKGEQFNPLPPPTFTWMNKISGHPTDHRKTMAGKRAP